MRLVALAFAVALPSASMTKCADIEHRTWVYPDGSGKIVLSVTVPKERGTQSPEASLAGIVEMCEGFAALLPPVSKEAGETKTLTWTIYFDDISRFRMKQTGGAQESLLSFSLEKGDKERTLVCRDDLLKNWLKKAGEPLRPEETAAASSDFYAFAITAPASVTRVEGAPPAKGRTIEARVDETLQFEIRKGDIAAKKRIEGLSPEIRITWPEAEAPAEEWAAFRKDFAAARAKWKSLEPKVRKILEEKSHR